jgi:uncharacterized RDD family membrane protein YckC
MEARVGFWPRLGAAFIDFVLVCIVAALVRKNVAGLFPDTVAAMLAKASESAGGKPIPEAMAGWFGFSLAIALLSPIYGLCEGLLGASPGKLILGLQVVQVVPDGHARAAQPQLLARYGVKQITSLLQLLATFLGIKMLEHATSVVSVVFVIGCFLVFGQARQALHDRIVGTAILRKSDLPEPVAAPVPG